MRPSPPPLPWFRGFAVGHANDAAYTSQKSRSPEVLRDDDYALPLASEFLFFYTYPARDPQVQTHRPIHSLVLLFISEGPRQRSG